MYEMADSIVNNCYYKGATIIVQLSLCREIHGLHFYAQCAGQIVNSYGYTFSNNAYDTCKIQLKWVFTNNVNKVSFRMLLKFCDAKI